MMPLRLLFYIFIGLPAYALFAADLPGRQWRYDQAARLVAWVKEKSAPDAKLW